jgi:type I restriction enzyme S subunit
MSSEWKEYHLDEVADLNGGYAFKSEEYTPTGCFVLRTVNITDDGCIDRKGAAFVSLESVEKYKRFSLQDFDTLYVMVGSTLGKTGLIKPADLPALLNQNMWVIRAKRTDVDPLFLHYSFKELSRPMNGLASGSARGFVKRDDFRRMKIRLPTFRTQQKIAETLGTLDDRITLLRETNATLEAIAQALFKSWFVDFDPVRAKMEGRAPEGMDEATAALFPDSLEETELGVVPTGWGVGTLADVATLNAQSLSTRNPPTEINYIDLTGVKANVFDVPQCYSFADAPSRARRILREGDCIVGTVRPGNRSFGFIATAQNNLTGSTGFAVLSPQQHWMAAYTYLCATRDESIGRLAALADGGAYPAVRPGVVASTPCIKPQDEVMKLFDSVARPLLDAISANSEQAQTLSTLRDTLLPRLISGQLRVAEAQTTVEKVFA